jgi:hypothetical protein
VSHWKVILAALVIFTAGLFAGGLGGRLLLGPRPPKRMRVEQPSLPLLVTEEFVHRMARDVDLSPAQREGIAKTVWASQARIREIYSLVGPEVSEELFFLRESILADLTPDQQKRFEEFMHKQRQRRGGDSRLEGQRPRSQGGVVPDRDGRRSPFRGPQRDSSNREPQRSSEPRVLERRSRPDRGATNADQPIALPALEVPLPPEPAR